MPRPMLKERQKNGAEETILSASKQKENAETLLKDKIALDRLLRKPRSKKYMEAMRKLDAGGETRGKSKADEIIAELRGEFPEVDMADVLLGYVSICRLGVPYEVHTLDPSGGIIEHYKKGTPLPGGLEKARSVAMRGGYSFIEVYADCLRAVSADGSVSVIKG